LKLDALIRFYEELAIGSRNRLREFYAEGAWFNDPFNEVRGGDAFRCIFADMFERLEGPRVVITEQVADEGGAMLVREFHFQLRSWRKNETQVIRGASHLKFDAAGRVVHHRDYWDAAEELYLKLPMLGLLMRRLRKTLSSQRRPGPGCGNARS
jgi:steroid delta-isomerase